MEEKLIYLSVGDDGGGPWAFARGLAGGLAEHMQKYGMQAHFIIDGRDDPRGEKGITDRVTAKGGKVVARHIREKLLWLPRDSRSNLVDSSRLENDVLKSFQSRVAKYWASVNFSKVDLVIAVVDPCAIAAANQHNKKSVGVTDHTWDVTMWLVLEQASLLNPHAQTILDYIGSLYGFADRMYLWPEPITPEDPFGVGAKLLGVDVRRLAGVIEGPDRTRSDVRSHYQISNDLPTVCISTGAQGALAQIIRDASNSYSARPPQGYNVVIDSTPSMVFQPSVNPVQVPKLPLVNLGSICDLLITRCGGGAINAAIASGLPWVTVLEPFHPQVNAIARCAQQMGLTRCVPYQTVALDPRAFIEYEFLSPARQAVHRAIRGRLYEYSWRAELRWADEVIRDFLLS